MRERAELRDSPKRSLTPFFLPSSLQALTKCSLTMTMGTLLLDSGALLWTVQRSVSHIQVGESYYLTYTRTYYVAIFSMIHPDKTRQDHPESRIQPQEGVCFVCSRDLRGSALKQTYGGMAGIWMSVTLRERC